MKKKSTNKKIRLNKKDIPFLVVFLIGVSIMAYPFFSDWYNAQQYKRVNVTFDRGAKKLDKKEVDERIQLAKYYNDALVNPNITDPFTRKKHKKGIEEYARMLQIKESIGYVTIPKIGQTLPIYAGTNDDILEIGAGHLEFTSLPIGGKGNHTVITAHSGLSKTKLFTDLNKLKKGDVFFIKNIKEEMAYEVDDIAVVVPTDFSKLNRFVGRDYCTLLTCTPYMINTHRLLVRGERTDLKKAKKKGIKDKLWYYIKRILILLAIILVIYLVKKRIKKYYDKIRRENLEKKKIIGQQEKQIEKE